MSTASGFDLQVDNIVTEINNLNHRVDNVGYKLCNVYSFLDTNLPEGMVPATGTLLGDASVNYPKAYAYLQTTEGQALCCTEAQWQAASTATYYTNAAGTAEGWNGVGGVAKFVVDTVANTIRVPDLRGMYMESAGLDSLNVGGVHGPGLPNITGRCVIVQNTSIDISGAFYNINIKYGYSVGGGISVYAGAMGFNASRSNLAYGEGGEQCVRPRAFGMLYCIYLSS